MKRWFVLFKSKGDVGEEVRGLFTCFADARHGLDRLVEAEGPGATWRIRALVPNACVDEATCAAREHSEMWVSSYPKVENQGNDNNGEQECKA